MLAVFGEPSLTHAAYVSTYMLEMPHMIKITVVKIKCYNSLNECYS